MFVIKILFCHSVNLPGASEWQSSMLSVVYQMTVICFPHLVAEVPSFQSVPLVSGFRCCSSFFCFSGAGRAFSSAAMISSERDAHGRFPNIFSTSSQRWLHGLSEAVPTGCDLPMFLQQCLGTSVYCSLIISCTSLVNQFSSMLTVRFVEAVFVIAVIT